LIFLPEGKVIYSHIATDNGDKGEKKKKSIAMRCVDKKIKEASELLYFYPNVNKRSLKFVEDDSENIPRAPPFYKRIGEMLHLLPRRAPVESLSSER